MGTLKFSMSLHLLISFLDLSFLYIFSWFLTVQTSCMPSDNIIEKLCNTIVLLHIKHVYVWGWSPWILYLSNPIVQKLNNGQYRYTTVWCAASDQTYDSDSYRTTFLLRFLFSLLKAHFNAVFCKESTASIPLAV